MGKITNGFGDECVLFSEINFHRWVNLSHIRTYDIKVTRWGREGDCDVCEYGTMAGACVSVILGALFLQCSNLGELQSRINISWMIVVPAIPVTLTFFVFSCVILAYTVGGLAYFCEHALNYTDEAVNLTSCIQLYNLNYPFQPFYAPTDYTSEVNLYVDFLLLQIGASLHLVGWGLALGILLLRCCCFADFQAGRMVPYERPVFDDLSDQVFSYPISVIREEDDSGDDTDSSSDDNEYASTVSSVGESKALL